MSSMAEAWDRELGEMVYVTSVAGNECLIIGQWSGSEGTRKLSELHATWPNTEIVDTLDEIIRAFDGDAQFGYHMITALTDNAEWAQLLVRVWSDLY